MEFTLERRLAHGTIRVVLQSADIPGHVALTGLGRNSAITLAMVNVLDVAESEMTKARREAVERDSNR